MPRLARDSNVGSAADLGLMGKVSVIQNPRIQVIGVYGSSDLIEDIVEALTRRSKGEGWFTVVARATLTTLTKKPDIKTIQKQIGESLGLTIDAAADSDEKKAVTEGSCFRCGKRKNLGQTYGDEKEVAERASRLCDKLKERQKILIVMNLQQSFDFSKF